MQELESYRRFRELTRRWVELEVELAKLRRDGGKSKRRNTEKEQKRTRWTPT
jgi:chromatin segregation and condensation protein Rec8/ScpA/Scc1 (kleisin family)